MNNDPITDEDQFRSHRLMREIARGNIPHETKHLAAMRTQRDVALDMCGKMITQNEELLKLRDEAIRERDQLRLDFDAEIRERRAAVCERDEARRERDEASAECDAARIETYRSTLMAYRVADRELCSLELTTRDAFARLHAAEDAADDLLGLPRIGRKPEREER